jgi:anti-sigma regulatory factor (Ser/Thr protein kinase)
MLLRDRIQAALPGLDAQVLWDLQLVATELVTNAYLHGRPPVSFELAAPPAGPTLRMEVSDTGVGVPRTEHPDVHTYHGRGLLLVGKLTAAWGVTGTAAGKTVWADFVIDAELGAGQTAQM